MPLFCAHPALCWKLQALHLPFLWALAGWGVFWEGFLPQPSAEQPAERDALSLPGVPRLALASVLPRTWLLFPSLSSHRREVGRGRCCHMNLLTSS